MKKWTPLPRSGDPALRAPDGRAQARGTALLDHDADDAHGRAIQIASMARSRELTGVALLANDLSQRIAKRRDRPGVGVGGAHEQLTDALERLLSETGASGPSKNT
jgi:hypothetical protein